MKHSFKERLIATRPWSLPASTMPALLAVSYVFYVREHLPSDINWCFGILAFVGAAVFQASGNLISDYFDYKYQVDRKESYGSSRMLVNGIFKPREILNYGLVLISIGSAIGLYLMFNTSFNLLWIGVLGVVSAFFYYRLKFIAFGDLTIFITYGLLIASGTYLVMTNTLGWRILLVSSSIGLLIVNILHANNTRDIKHDSVANIKTLAMLLGIKKSVRLYIIFGYGAYLIIILSVILGILHPVSLIVIVSVPVLLNNIKEMRKAHIDNPETIKDMDGRSAQLVLIFSLLLIASNVVAGLL